VLKVAVSGMHMCKLFVTIINADLLYTSRLICTAGHVCLVLKLLNGQCIGVLQMDSAEFYSIEVCFSLWVPLRCHISTDL